MKFSGNYPWKPWRFAENSQPPAVVGYEASMTQRLGEISGRKAVILKRKESIAKAAARDCLFLDQTPTTWLWQREILLGRDSPWLYGYTLTLPVTRSNGLWDLHRLGSKPLGEKLFTTENVWRDFFDVGEIGPEHSLWHKVNSMNPGVPEKLWGRCSVFNYQGNPLLLYEVLFPGCPGLS
jgi:chorismate--pyruvate lyase